MGRGHAADDRGYGEGSRCQNLQDRADPLRAVARFRSRKAGKSCHIDTRLDFTERLTSSGEISAEILE